MKRAVLVSCVASLLFALPALAGGPVKFADPAGDDKGNGKYEYPTDGVYKPGSFDMTAVEIEEKGDSIQFSVTMKVQIEDPWNSKTWTPPGQGFSLQFIQIYIDTDHKAGSGHTVALPGINVKFAADQAWDKVVLISPQPVSRLKSEVTAKAGALAKAVVVPKSVQVRGKTLTVTVPKSELGGAMAGWGFQVVVQSNEGYPDAADLLTRDVNEVVGEHRFGGGSDWDCDPHAIDILAGEGKGDASEKAAQFKALAFSPCKGSDAAPSATVPMLYPK